MKCNKETLKAEIDNNAKQNPRIPRISRNSTLWKNQFFPKSPKMVSSVWKWVNLNILRWNCLILEGSTSFGSDSTPSAIVPPPLRSLLYYTKPLKTFQCHTRNPFHESIISFVQSLKRFRCKKWNLRVSFKILKV